MQMALGMKRSHRRICDSHTHTSTRPWWGELLRKAARSGLPSRSATVRVLAVVRQHLTELKPNPGGEYLSPLDSSSKPVHRLNSEAEVLEGSRRPCGCLDIETAAVRCSTVVQAILATS
jgi:hypothetical protein